MRLQCFVLFLLLGLTPAAGIAQSSLAKISASAPSSSAPAISPADVRLVIDISGSMKKTDPGNLRRPAVDLMMRLLPERSKAGIWTFGQSVTAVMPYRSVDKAWRAQAINAARGINSVAMFTNIGAALEQATAGETPATGARHNLVLLTDGVVDIDPEAVTNLNERRRILSEVLPRLKADGYVIHTIALSDAADQELMKKLSQATDGVFAVAKTADELMATFLRIFDQAVPVERVPLENNGFLVDASIKEFTALIFRKADVPTTILVAPDGTEFSGTDPAHNLNWYKTSQYDLITVQGPIAGRWQVKTDMAPDSRVTVVSNLQLAVAPPKINLKLDEPLALAYSFTENGQTITTPEFLQLLTMNAFVGVANNPQGRVDDLTPAQVPADGVFHSNIAGFSEAGDYDIRLAVDGKTFKREFVHHVQVGKSSFVVDRRDQTKDGAPQFEFSLTGNVDAVDIANIRISAVVVDNKGAEQTFALEPPVENRWLFVYQPPRPGRYEVSFRVTGKAIDGAPLEETLSTPPLVYEAPASSSASSQAEAPPSTTAAEPQGSTVWLYLAIAVANLVVLALGYLAYRLIAGGKNKGEISEFEETLNTDVSKLAPAAARVIDVADEEPELNLQPPDADDDSLADGLFPLDNLDEPSSKDSNSKDPNSKDPRDS